MIVYILKSTEKRRIGEYSPGTLSTFRKEKHTINAVQPFAWSTYPQKPSHRTSSRRQSTYVSEKKKNVKLFLLQISTDQIII